MLTVQNVVKAFGDVVAVEGVSFEVDDGELFTLLGPSACGKTTTLRCIAGLEKPDAGEVVVAGRVLFSSQTAVDVPASKRGLGLVFQSYAIWPHMNVFQNVAFPLTAESRRKRASKTEIRTRVGEVLAVVKLGELAGRPATDLSGGQQQRLALARALVMRPRLLLLDEPLSNLDAKLREEMRFELKRLQRELGIAAVYVTHDQVEALAMSDRIAVMAEGRLEQVGRPRDVYERPASRFVADFVGAANLIDGVIEAAEPNGVFGVETSAGSVRGVSAAPFATGARVVLVVRPEHVELSADGRTRNGAWPGTVLATAYMGDAVEHVVAARGLELRARSSPAASLPAGAQVTIGFEPEHCLLVPHG